jgi:hypothetical protein
MLLLAQAGLNGPQTRRGLDPQLRDAYLSIIKSADISRLDRGETKSVRAVFDVTADFLKAVAAAPPSPPTVTPAIPASKKNTPKPRSRKPVQN